MLTPNLNTIVRGNTRAYLAINHATGLPSAAVRDYPRENGGIGSTLVIVKESHHPDRFTVAFRQVDGAGPDFDDGTYRTDAVRARALLSLSSAESARTYISANQR